MVLYFTLLYTTTYLHPYPYYPSLPLCLPLSLSHTHHILDLSLCVGPSQGGHHREWAYGLSPLPLPTPTYPYLLLYPLPLPLPLPTYPSPTLPIPYPTLHLLTLPCTYHPVLVASYRHWACTLTPTLPTYPYTLPYPSPYPSFTVHPLTHPMHTIPCQ